ncbi:MAG: helix-turn-helix domain-containing protein [Prevotellaceae bacterium]|nr:helix-turn-helix domain-containing protein [Prevotellaceae bacterium]
MSYIDLYESYAEVLAKCQEQHDQLVLFKKKSDEQEKRIRLLESKQLALKDILTLEEGSEYTGISKSTLYKMTSAHEIPYYKPHGKLIFFERKELDYWLRQNPVKSMRQIHAEAERTFLSSSFNNQ